MNIIWGRDCRYETTWNGIRMGRVSNNSKDLIPKEGLHLLEAVFHIDQKDIQDIALTKSGMTNRSYLFSLQGERFLLRIPGEGTAQLINRGPEPIRFGRRKLRMYMDSMNPDYVPFESLKKALEAERDTDVMPMFVCHPGYLDAYILQKSSLTLPRPMETEMACSRQVKDYLREQGIQVVTYEDMKR